MKKLFTIIFILISASAFAQSDDNSTLNELPDNQGYMKSRGMVGIYGFIPDFHSKTLKDGNIGGGGFVYYNLTNMFWGNFMLGLSSDYTFVRASRSEYNANINIAPVTLNFAYMTSSDMLNVWGGFGGSYTFADVDIRNVTVSGVSHSVNKKMLTGFWGADLFVGGEYIFSTNPKFGAFFEFRYTFTTGLDIKQDFTDIGAHINDTMTMQRMRYTVGFTFHF